MSVERFVLSPVEAAEALGVSRTVLFSLLRSKRLPSFRLGARRLIEVADVHRLVEQLKAEDDGQRAPWHGSPAARR